MSQTTGTRKSPGEKIVKDLQRATHFIGTIHRFAEQCLVRAEQRTDAMGLLALHMRRAKPTGAQNLSDAKLTTTLAPTRMPG